MGACPMKDSGAFLRAVHGFLWFHKLVCKGLLLVSVFLPLSFAAMFPLLECQQTLRRQRTG